ncbi:MAG: DUF4123 domain-containing protein [Lysobacter sp.]
MSPDVPASLAPTTVSGLLDLLGELQSTHRQRHCSALIDLARFADLADCAKVVAMDASAFTRLPNVYEGFTSALESRGPRLFTAPLRDPAWRHVCELTIRQGTASFIFHDQSPDSFKTHLASLAKASQPDGSKRLFRFQDSIVLSSLGPLLTRQQIRSMVGPAKCWLVLDVCGHPVRLEREGDISPVNPPLRLSQQQVSELELRLRPAGIIAQVNEVDTALLHGKTRCEQWRVVRAAMHQAVQHDLSTKDDIAFFSVLSLQLPAGFDHQGPVAKALQRSRQENISFGQAIDQVPTEEWRAWDEHLDAAGMLL